MTLIEEIAFQRLDQRLATLLLSQGPTIEATPQQLADELGSVREVIGRLLRDFQAKGAVVLERGCLRMIDKAILQQIARSEGDASPRHHHGGML